MKLRNIISGLFIVIFVSGGIYVTFIVGKDVDKVTQKNKDVIESRIGSTVFIDGDSLTIMDYSRYYENYTLSNGQKLSFKYFDK